MTDLTSLTLAEARDGLANKSFTSLELTDAHIEAIEAARALNAFVWRRRKGARHGAPGRCQDRQGRGRAARRHSASASRICSHQGRAHHRRLENPRQFRAAL